jgi:hypothetical protein
LTFFFFGGVMGKNYICSTNPKKVE